MKKFIIVTCLALLLNFSSVAIAEVSNSEVPDTSRFWGVLIFGPGQIEMEGLVPDLLILHLVGQNAGWTMKQEGDVYRVTFLSAFPMPTLILTEFEYGIFRAIHVDPPYVDDEFLLIPTGPQVSKDYDEILLNLETISHLELTMRTNLFTSLYSLQAVRDGVKIPLVSLDQDGYELLMSGLASAGAGPILRFDALREVGTYPNEGESK